ncbi:MAG TPA: c-type cytochrome [Hanamia sp.]|nr:c-type cytochrome [Hanamia sp.]
MIFIKKQCGLLIFFLLLQAILPANRVAAQSKGPWVAPKEADNLKNPLAGNTEILKYAKVLYVSYCGPCHGNNGKGDGIAAAGLTVKPADHTSAKVQAQTDGALFWMMTTGRSPMPSYKTTLPEIQRWELVNYIRSLAKNKK